MSIIVNTIRNNDNVETKVEKLNIDTFDVDTGLSYLNIIANYHFVSQKAIFGR